MSKVILNDGGVETVPVADLKHHPKNPNQGDQGAIYESIKRTGFYGAVIVQRSTGFILAGNHRVRAARDAGITEVPVIYVDVDDEVATRILLADNRLASLAMQDQEQLRELLIDLAEGKGLEGTGYDGDDLDQLIKDLDGDDEFIKSQRAGEGSAQGYEEQYGVIVMCDGEEEQAAVYDKLRALGYTCKVVTT